MLYTWGRIIGMQITEELASAAVVQGEVEPRENPTNKGPRILYSMVEVKAHPSVA